jgi:hypothetical protein
MNHPNSGEPARRGTGAWKCPGCGEINPASFDVCWNCQPNREEPPDADSQAASPAEAELEPSKEERQALPCAASGPEDKPSVDLRIGNAWLATILGILFVGGGQIYNRHLVKASLILALPSLGDNVALGGDVSQFVFACVLHFITPLVGLIVAISSGGSLNLLGLTVQVLIVVDAYWHARHAEVGDPREREAFERQADALAERAFERESQGQDEEALQLYDEVIKKYPGTRAAEDARAWIEARRRQEERSSQ